MTLVVIDKSDLWLSLNGRDATIRIHHIWNYARRCIYYTGRKLIKITRNSRMSLTISNPRIQLQTVVSNLPNFREILVKITIGNSIEKY